MNIRHRSVLLAAALALVASAPVHAAAPFGNTACSGVRPGAAIQAPRGNVVTMGFVFKGTTRKGSAYYTTSIGSNVLAGFGTKKWPSGGPQVYDSNNKAIGRYVYALYTDFPDARSFGLIKLDSKAKPNAQVCHFGGPTAIYGETSLVPVAVEYYGNGFPLDRGVRARTAVATGTSDPENVFIAGPITWSIDSGDEGAPFLADGKALGYHDGAVGGGGPGAGFVVSRLGPWLAQIDRALGIDLELLTAPRL